MTNTTSPTLHERFLCVYYFNKYKEEKVVPEEIKIKDSNFVISLNKDKYGFYALLAKHKTSSFWYTYCTENDLYDKITQCYLFYERE